MLATRTAICFHIFSRVFCVAQFGVALRKEITFVQLENQFKTKEFLNKRICVSKIKRFILQYLLRHHKNFEYCFTKSYHQGNYNSKHKIWIEASSFYRLSCPNDFDRHISLSYFVIFIFGN